MPSESCLQSPLFTAHLSSFYGLVICVAQHRSKAAGQDSKGQSCTYSEWLQCRSQTLQCKTVQITTIGKSKSKVWMQDVWWPSSVGKEKAAWENSWDEIKKGRLLNKSCCRPNQLKLVKTDLMSIKVDLGSEKQSNTSTTLPLSPRLQFLLSHSSFLSALVVQKGIKTVSRD